MPSALERDQSRVGNNGKWPGGCRRDKTTEADAPVLSEERSMPDEKPPETKVTDRLFATYVGSDRRVLDIDSFKAAFVKALSDAYERGLEDGLATKATGPDA
jgi:hypothetical protein